MANEGTHKVDTDSQKSRELAKETIEQEAEQSNHSNATNLTGASTENNDEHREAGMPKGFNNDR